MATEFRSLRGDLAEAIESLRQAKVPQQSLDMEITTLKVKEALISWEEKRKKMGHRETEEDQGPSSSKVAASSSLSPFRIRDRMLDTIWKPLLSRLIYLSRELITPQGYPRQAQTTRGTGPPPAGMFSMADFNHLRTALEIIVLWGITPHLEDGVGIPINRRPESKAVTLPRTILAWGTVVTPAGEEGEGGADVSEKDGKGIAIGKRGGEEGKGGAATTAGVEHGGKEREGAAAAEAAGRAFSFFSRKNMSSMEEEEQANKITKSLIECADILEGAMELEQFSSLFQIRYGSDLLAIYLQLHHWSTGDHYKASADLHQEITHRLGSLSNRLGPRILVTGLRGLLAGGSIVPAWMRRECSTRLTSVLMNAGGLRAVLEAFIGGIPASEECNQAHIKVAQLLSSVPNSIAPKDYMAALAPQFPPLLHSPARDRDVVQRLLTLVIGRLCQRMPNETRDQLLFPLLLQPLLRPSQEIQRQEWKEEEVNQALDDLYLLLTAAPPLPALTNCLAVPQLFDILLELYLFAKRTSARGAAEAETVLLTLLQHADDAHKLLLHGYLSILDLVASDEGGRKAGRRRRGGGKWIFAPGGSGGIARRLMEGAAEEVERGQPWLDSDSNSEKESETAAGVSSVVEELKGLGLHWLEKRLVVAEQATTLLIDLIKALGKGSMVPGRILERLMVLYLKLKGVATTKGNIHQHCCRENWDLAVQEKEERKHQKSLAAAEEEEEEEEDVGEELLIKELVRAPALLMLLEKLVALGPSVLGSGEQIIKCCGLILFLATSTTTTAATISSSDEKQSVATTTGSGSSSSDQKEQVERRGEDGSAVEELASVVLGLLGVLLEMGEEGRVQGEEAALRDLLPLLQRLGQDRRKPALAEMALTIQAMILTRSLSKEERREQRQREEEAVLAARSSRQLKDVLVAIKDDLESPMIPLRARGIVTLTKVVHGIPRGKMMTQVIREVGSAEEEGEGGEGVVKEVLYLLMRMLGEKESFVYLAAIQALAVLSDKATNLVMDRLLLELTGHQGKGSPVPAVVSGGLPRSSFTIGEEEESGLTITPPAVNQWTYRLKVGQVLVQALQRCGEAMPIYASKVIPIFIQGAQKKAFSLLPAQQQQQQQTKETSQQQQQQQKGQGPPFENEEEEEKRRKGEAAELMEDEAHFRASCLSGLADICELLGWSLRRYFTDIIDLVQGIFKLEQGSGQPSTLMRRAAAFLVERMMLGAGPERIFDVVNEGGRGQGGGIQEQLKRIADCDKDNVTRLHARRALQAVEDALMAQVDKHLDPSQRFTALQELTDRLEGGSRLQQQRLMRMMMMEDEEEGADNKVTSLSPDDREMPE